MLGFRDMTLLRGISGLLGSSGRLSVSVFTDGIGKEKPAVGFSFDSRRPDTDGRTDWFGPVEPPIMLGRWDAPDTKSKKMFFTSLFRPFFRSKKRPTNNIDVEPLRSSNHEDVHQTQKLDFNGNQHNDHPAASNKDNMNNIDRLYNVKQEPDLVDCFPSLTLKSSDPSVNVTRRTQQRRLSRSSASPQPINQTAHPSFKKKSSNPKIAKLVLEDSAAATAAKRLRASEARSERAQSRARLHPPVIAFISRLFSFQMKSRKTSKTTATSKRKHDEEDEEDSQDEGTSAKVMRKARASLLAASFSYEGSNDDDALAPEKIDPRQPRAKRTHRKSQQNNGSSSSMAIDEVPEVHDAQTAQTEEPAAPSKKASGSKGKKTLSESKDPKTSSTPQFLTDIKRPKTSTFHANNHPRWLHQMNAFPPTLSQRLIPAVNVFASLYDSIKVHKTTSYFDRRVTAIEWHPDHARYPNVVALGSKGGDIVWYDYQQDAKHSGFVPTATGTSGRPSRDDPPEVPFLYGQGPGGSITGMKFHPELPNMLYTTSIDGTIACKDFEGRHGRIFLDTMSRKNWYTALAVSKTSKLISVGSTNGDLIFTDRDGREVWSGRPFKNKIHDINFHPVRDNLLVAGGNDRIVKLFDVRFMKKGFQDEEDLAHLVALDNDGVINSATFSPVAPYSLLTCLQTSECRIFYDIANETLRSAATSCIIPHPHRPFQHLTAIRADWHPTIGGMFCVGRYPPSENPTDRRTIDVFYWNPSSLDSEIADVKIVSRIEDARVSGIHSLAKFNVSGDVIAGCSGFTSYIWKVPEILERSGVRDENEKDEGINTRKKRSRTEPGPNKGGAEGKKLKLQEKAGKKK
ncbi:DNA damage-binding protein 2 [Blyttiomyces sp. JEL0837]|nr:DNA damage-binding protein 2 [Blyttiomyces sp. JEL0837]